MGVSQAKMSEPGPHRLQTLQYHLIPRSDAAHHRFQRCPESVVTVLAHIRKKHPLSKNENR